jgi:hypothetical protein
MPQIIDTQLSRQTADDKMLADLRMYCGQDTMAMVELLKVVRERAVS